MRRNRLARGLVADAIGVIIAVAIVYGIFANLHPHHHPAPAPAQRLP